MAVEDVVVRLEQREGYEFEARFAPGVPPLACDEPPPLGRGAGPSPVELLAAAVGNCLCDSLLFAFRKFKEDPGLLAGEVACRVGRNAEGRVRVLGMSATLRLGVPAQGLPHVDRVLAQFEAFCTVTQSVAPAIPVELAVLDSTGAKLK